MKQTVLEYLIAVVVVAVLVGVSVPAFQKAKRSASHATTASMKPDVSGPRAPPPMQNWTPEWDAAATKAVTRLNKGNLAYSTPEKMKTGETGRVAARIGSDQVLLEELRAGLPSGAGTATATVATPVSTQMKMMLKSADFDITPLSSEEQMVGGSTPTNWEWDVAPKHAGKLRLHLAAVVVLNGLARDFTTVDREIAVQVDPWDAAGTFVKGNTVWVLGTMGAGLAGFWTWWKRRKKPKPPGWEVP